MKLRRLVFLGMSFAVLVVTCVSCTGHARSSLPFVTPLPSRACNAGRASGAQAWAEDVSAAGKVLWQRELTAQQQDSSAPYIEPVTMAGMAVFADDGSVYGLRLSDGQLLWRSVISRPLNGMWAWSSSVIVLAGQDTAAPVLVSLDATTGEQHWAWQFSQGEFVSESLTSAGGLATVTASGALQMLSLDTGKVRWSVQGAGSGSVPEVDGSVVAVADGNGHERGYETATGRLRWSDGGIPAQPATDDLDGLILVSGPSPAVTALSPLDGRVMWRLHPDVPLVFGSGGAGAIAMESISGPSRQAALYLVSAADGHIRWHVFTASEGITVPLVTAADVAYVQTSPDSAMLIDRAASDGTLRWPAESVPGQTSAVTQMSSGMAVISNWIYVTGAVTLSSGSLTAFDLATGKQDWTRDLPAAAAGDPVIAPSGMLVQPEKAPPTPCGAQG